MPVAPGTRVSGLALGAQTLDSRLDDRPENLGGEGVQEDGASAPSLVRRSLNVADQNVSAGTR